jgi:predicted alpha/beta superfamily hydrolase
MNNTILKWNAAFALIVLCCFCGCAQTCPPGTTITTLNLPSKVLGESRRILVRTPANYSTTNLRYPVLYITDGDPYMGHTVNSVDYLARYNRISELIVVAITHTDRTHDLTPTRVDADSPTSGGADKLLEFLEEELIPEIGKRYRVQPYRILAGHSFGGLFTLHTMFSRPELFNAYIAASPSLRWDNELLVKRAAEFFKSRKQFAATLALSTSGVERDTNVTAFEKFMTLLRQAQIKDFAWDLKTLPDEDHGSMVMLSYYYGLRKIFEGWQGPATAETSDPVEDLKAYELHFLRLSQRFGYTIPASEMLINAVGYRLLAAGKIAEAISAFKSNVTNYPESANAYDSLGEAYEKNGQIDLALPVYEKAESLGRQTKDANLATFQQHVDRARKLTKH